MGHSISSCSCCYSNLSLFLLFLLLLVLLCSPQGGIVLLSLLTPLSGGVGVLLGLYTMHIEGEQVQRSTKKQKRVKRCTKEQQTATVLLDLRRLFVWLHYYNNMYLKETQENKNESLKKNCFRFKLKSSSNTSHQLCSFYCLYNIGFV